MAPSLANIQSSTALTHLFINDTWSQQHKNSSLKGERMDNNSVRTFHAGYTSPIKKSVDKQNSAAHRWMLYKSRASYFHTYIHIFATYVFSLLSKVTVVLKNRTDPWKFIRCKKCKQYFLTKSKYRPIKIQCQFNRMQLLQRTCAMPQLEITISNYR